MSTSIDVAGTTVTLCDTANLDNERRELFAELVSTIVEGFEVTDSIHGPQRVYAPATVITPVLDELIVDIELDEYRSAVEAAGQPIAALRALASGRHPNGWQALAPAAAAQVLSALQTRAVAATVADLLAGRATTTTDPAPAPLEVGTFVGLGAEQVTRGGLEWLVDPDTGCITGPATAVLEGVR